MKNKILIGFSILMIGISCVNSYTNHKENDIHRTETTTENNNIVLKGVFTDNGHTFFSTNGESWYIENGDRNGIGYLVYDSKGNNNPEDDEYVDSNLT